MTHDHVDQGGHHQQDGRVVDVFQVMAPGLPLAADLAAEDPEAADPDQRADGLAVRLTS
jgi:hypothetical protein